MMEMKLIVVVGVVDDNNIVRSRCKFLNNFSNTIDSQVRNERFITLLDFISYVCDHQTTLNVCIVCSSYCYKPIT